MAQGKKDHHENTLQHGILNRHEAQDGGNEAKGADTGQKAVGKAKEQGAFNASDMHTLQESAGRGALRRPQQGPCCPEQQDSNRDLPVRADVTQHPANERARNADGDNGYEQTADKGKGVAGRKAG